MDSDVPGTSAAEYGGIVLGVSAGSPPDGLEYLTLVPSYDAQHVQNVVQTSTADGVTWPAANNLPTFNLVADGDLAAEAGIIKSPTSVAEFYQQALSRNPAIALTSPTYGDRTNELVNQASYLIAFFKNPKYRFDQLKLQPMDNASLWAQALGKEISDRVTVKRHPANQTTGGGGNLIRRDCFVEQIGWVMEGLPEDWILTLQLSPAGHPDDYPANNDTPTWFVIGDPVYGTLSGGNRLVY